ncbi:MAG: hypothetical protein O7H41_17005 [Planctomycetota bacterium]|nr:hypothetical protein [Planctomycetota bacterium]
MENRRSFRIGGGGLIALGLVVALIYVIQGGSANAGAGWRAPAFLPGPTPPSTLTHLGVPAQDIVMLQISFLDDDDFVHFQRIFANGDLGAEEFRVPKDRFFIATDYEFTFFTDSAGAGTSWSMAVYLDLPGPNPPRRVANCGATSDIHRGGWVCWSGTTGFAVAAGGAVAVRAEAIASQGLPRSDVREALIRGYLVDARPGGGRPTLR